VDELGAQLDWNGDRRIAGGEQPPADARACLENLDAQPGGRQVTRGGETGDPGADDRDVGRLSRAERGLGPHTSRWLAYIPLGTTCQLQRQ
jgi:hypothetical protein